MGESGSGEDVDLCGLALAFAVRQARELLSCGNHFTGVATMLGIDAYR